MYSAQTPVQTFTPMTPATIKSFTPLASTMQETPYVQHYLFEEDVQRYLSRFDQEALVFTNLKSTDKNVYIFGGAGAAKTSSSIAYLLSKIEKDSLIIVIKNINNELNEQNMNSFRVMSDSVRIVDNIVPSKEDNVLFTSYYRMTELVSQVPHKKVYILLDEIAQFFNSNEVELYEMVKYIEGRLTKDTSLDEMRSILLEVQRDSRCPDRLFSKVTSCFEKKQYTMIEHFLNFFKNLKSSEKMTQCIFLSATGEEYTESFNGKKDLPGDILREIFRVFGELETFRASKIATVEYRYVVEMTHGACADIGGTYFNGKTDLPQITEAKLKVLAENVMPKVRSIIVARNSQREAITEMLNSFILEYGSDFMYTESLDFFNSHLEYRFLIAYDNELKKYQGINIKNLRALYFLSLGRETNVPDLIQTLGRVGRADQEISFVFVITEVGSNKAARREDRTRDIIKRDILEGANVIRIDESYSGKLRFLPMPFTLTSSTNGKKILENMMSEQKREREIKRNVPVRINKPSYVESGKSFLSSVGAPELVHKSVGEFNVVDALMASIAPIAPLPVVSGTKKVVGKRICDGHINNMCKRGDACSYSHDFSDEERDARIAEVRKENGICPYYLVGKCSNKDHLCLREHKWISDTKARSKLLQEVNTERVAKGLTPIQDKKKSDKKSDNKSDNKSGRK